MALTPLFTTFSPMQVLIILGATYENPHARVTCWYINQIRMSSVTIVHFVSKPQFVKQVLWPFIFNNAQYKTGQMKFLPLIHPHPSDVVDVVTRRFSSRDAQAVSNTCILNSLDPLLISFS